MELNNCMRKRVYLPFIRSQPQFSRLLFNNIKIHIIRQYYTINIIQLLYSITEV